tara:strand:- start:14499 stop:15065 length:567 start_codon:yes stop_codon:yes gene_type:complete
MKTVLPVATVAALALGLSGCAFLPGAGPSITLDAFELEAESLALDLTGVAADVECGSGSIPFEVGSEAECAMTDPNSDDAATVVFGIAAIRSSDDFDLEVLDVVDTSGDPSSGHPTVPLSEIEELAAGSLEQQGVIAAVLCEATEIEIFEDNTFRCGLVFEDGGFGEAVVSIIDFDGSSYSVVAAVVE